MGMLGSKYNFCVAQTLPQESATALCLSGIEWKQFTKVIPTKVILFILSIFFLYFI